MMEIIRVKSELMIVGFFKRIGIGSPLHALLIKIIGTFSATPSCLKWREVSLAQDVSRM
jgi:hypothetical protein